MDVAAIDVGTDFVQQVEDAIAESDVSLVVIGPQWLRATDAEGHRRLDDPNDHVRSEVRSALASANPVVPVLVGSASLPAEGDLPDDLSSLVRRQAIELRDETWPQDVEMLIRRLEGKDAVRQPRRYLPIGIGLVVLVVAGVALWNSLVSPGDEDELTGCPLVDAVWTSVDVAADATGLQELDDVGALRYTVTDAAFKADSDVWDVVLEVRLTNQTEEVPGTNDDHTGFGPSLFDALYVDRVSVGGPWCFPEDVVDSDLGPGEAAIVSVGFRSTLDPTGVELKLETDGPTQIVITPGS